MAPEILGFRVMRRSELDMLTSLVKLMSIPDMKELLEEIEKETRVFEMTGDKAAVEFLYDVESLVLAEYWSRGLVKTK